MASEVVKDLTAPVENITRLCFFIDKSSQPSFAHIQGKAMPGTHVCRLFAPWLSIFMLQEIMTYTVLFLAKKT